MLLLTVLVANAVGLWPELSITRVDLNDNVFHYTLIERIVDAIHHGGNPLDCWSPEWSFGYPVLRTYQPLAHWLVAATYFALGQSAGLMTVFIWIRFLSFALLPLSFFAAARLMGLPPLTAAASAMLAPLISTNFLYGVEYGSFIWAGSGLFPQAVATHLLLISLGLGFRAVRFGKNQILTGALLGLTFLAHLIYGYMGILSICLLALVPDAEVPRRLRVWRVAIVGTAALLLSAFQLAPLILDSSNINHSRWEAAWKWDSFGAPQAVKWLFTGGILDYNRLPVLTLLALGSAGFLIWRRMRRKGTCAAHVFILSGATFWTLFFFGRPFWGPLLVLLGVSPNMHLHRVIGGAQIFLLLLAAIGLAELWNLPSRRWQYGLVAAATLLIFLPMVQERARTLSNNAAWGARNLAAHDAERAALDAAVAIAKARGGRAYAGLAASWGGQFKVGDVPFYAWFSEEHVPALAFAYHSMALTTDVMLRFNEWNAFQYSLFNIRTVVAPADANLPLPPFLQPLTQIGRFNLFAAPGNSYFDVVDVLATVSTTRNNFYDINDRWLGSDWLMKRAYLRLERRGDAGTPLLRLSPDDGLPQLPPLPSPGEVRSERRDGEVYQAEMEAGRPSYALFKMTWHANWNAWIDGNPVETVMLSPGFIGVPLPAGRHTLIFRYEPERWKTTLAFAGLSGIFMMIFFERRGLFARLESWTPSWTLPVSARQRILTAGGLVLLSLPICIPLFSGSVLWGHDAFVYFPRLVEIHQNFTHGIFLPRWAPDLGRGTGQPLFLFHPPMIYCLGEFWHLLGFDFVIAMNLACATIVVLSATAMFLLARLYFGSAGGWLAAAAYLYVPYFAVDLYVRSAMEEFAAFPFLALTLFGFGAYAKRRTRNYWLIGAVAYAAVLFCHFPAALLFTPLLLFFLAFTAWLERSWSVCWKLAAGFLLGLGLSAVIWIPALAAREWASMNRAVEGNGKFSNHFVYLHQLFFSPWGYGYSLPGPDDGMSFALGWSHLLLLAVVWIWASRNPTLVDHRWLRFFTVAAAILCFLTLEDASWMWTQLPLLQTVQLPWRLLGPVALCVALLIAPLGTLLSSVPRWRACGMVAAMALLIIPNLSHFHARQSVDVDLSFWTPQQLSLRGFESTTMAEVTPHWMRGLPSYSPLAATIQSGDAEIISPGRTPFSWSSRVNAKVPSALEINTAWFPGWEARLDGQPVTAGPNDMTGLMMVRLPAGGHSLEVVYCRTPIEKVAAGVSILSVFLTFGLMLTSSLKSRLRAVNSTHPD